MHAGLGAAIPRLVESCVETIVHRALIMLELHKSELCMMGDGYHINFLCRAWGGIDKRAGGFLGKVTAGVGFRYSN